MLNFVGSPFNRSVISISYFEGTSPHCLSNCYAIEFSGVGTRRAVSATEPSVALIVALGLAAAATARARRRTYFRARVHHSDRRRSQNSSTQNEIPQSPAITSE